MIAWAVLLVAGVVFAVCTWKLGRITAEDTAERATEAQLDRDFQWLVHAARSPIMAEQFVARELLIDLFDYDPSR